MTTGITWTEETWNPIVGCSIVSKGCTNCYAMQWAGQRMDGNPMAPHYAGTTKQVNGHHVWTGKLAKAPETTLLKPLRWTRPRMIFVNSMSDLFHESVPDEWIDQIFAVMALTPQHTYQILTKRPERMKAYLQVISADKIAATAAMLWGGKNPDDIYRQAFEVVFTGGSYTLPNAWLGVSVEDQATADERIPLLLETPAAVRWVSAEPLLGPVDLRALALPENWGKCDCTDFPTTVNAYEATVYCEGCCEGAESMDCGHIDWVVIGGESGRDVRPMHPDWARSLRDQCADAEVPFFFKQWGEWKPICEMVDAETDRCYYPAPRTRPDATRRERVPSIILHTDGQRFDGDDRYKWGAFEAGKGATTLFKVGKAAAGDRLDGVQHHNWPEVH